VVVVIVEILSGFVMPGLAPGIHVFAIK